MDFENDIIANWFPNTIEMYKKTMEDPNLSFYPSQTSILKVFDFAHQKTNIGDKEDDFYSVDQKVTTAQKGKKGAPVKKATTTAPGKKQIPIKSTTTNKFRVSQTIQIKPEWKLIADYNKQSLDKLRLEESKVEFEDLTLCGSLYKISEDFEKDKINPISSVPLSRFDDVKFYGHISTLQDDRIKANLDVADIFCTDKILTVIMTMIANSRPWHLKITKIGDSIFIDKPENSDIDLVTLNESDNTPVDDANDKNIDNFKNLAIESTHINEFIKQQVISLDNKYEGSTEPHPFAPDTNEENLEKVVYNYRVWTIVNIDIIFIYKILLNYFYYLKNLL